MKAGLHIKNDVDIGKYYIAFLQQKSVGYRPFEKLECVCYYLSISYKLISTSIKNLFLTNVNSTILWTKVVKTV